MKILQINNHFYKKGGADTVFLNTVALLEAHGHNVYTLSRKTRKDQTPTEQDFFIHTPEFRFANFNDKIKYFRSFFYNKEAVQVLQKIIDEHKPEIAHIHLLYNGISPSILPVLKEHNIPVVMTIHDYRLICPNYWLLDKNGNICEKCIDKCYFRCTTNRCSDTFINSLMLSFEAYYRKKINPLDYVDRFIFPSQFIKNKFAQFNPDFAKKADVLCNFSNYISSDKISEKENYFFYFGRLSREKGLMTLLDAVKDLPEVVLKIAGTGPLLDILTKEKPKNVDFTGFKTGSALEDLIKKAKFVVVPSEWYEVFGLASAEAQSLGTPVLGTNIGGTPELIENGKNGSVLNASAKKDGGEIPEKAHPEAELKTDIEASPGEAPAEVKDETD